jgi:hypothetical protein
LVFVRPHDRDDLTEELLARLADAAYRVALRRGVRGPFIDLELELWRALRAAAGGDGNSPPPASSGGTVCGCTRLFVNVVEGGS